MPLSPCIRQKRTESFLRPALLGLLLLGLTGVAAAGPLDWFGNLFRDREAAAHKVDGAAGDRDTPILLGPGKSLRLQLDDLAPTYHFADGASRYRRITLRKPLDHAVIRFRVLTQHHEVSPRFTALAPQLHLLDQRGLIRESVPVRGLKLNIAPFRPTELRGCVRVDNLHSFLLAADGGQVDTHYRYNARPRSGSYPQRGFYRSSDPLNVSLTWSGVGELILKVVPAAKKTGDCHVPS